jgi:serine/threonine-protein kinase
MPDFGRTEPILDSEGLQGERVSHYQILEELGGGGMGVVYKALDVRLERTVALKFLPPHMTRDPIAKERFAREARAASALDHPNICTIYEVDETPDGRLFLAMAYYQGENLRQRISRGAVPLAEALAIALQVSRGLAAAHAAEIVHRDIKPANIMLPKGAEAKILDFGLAKLGRDPKQLTRTGSTMGTLGYMAPEQVSTGAYDARSDLWSLGVLLYEMLAGHAPFQGEHEATLLYRIVNDEPPPLAGPHGEFPRGVEAVLEMLLAKDPDQRFQSAAALSTALDSLARGGSLAETSVVKTGSMRMRVRPVERRAPPRRAPWPVLAALGIVALGAGSWYAVERSRAAPAVTARGAAVSLAVLPFRNLTGDAALDYFAEGLSSVLTQQLASISGLNVVARSESASYRGSDRSVKEIGRELGVTALVTGEVVSVGGDRLSAQTSLVSPETGQIRWSGPTAEGTPEEILRWQTKIAEEIADELSLSLTSAQKKRLNKRPTDSPEAYDLYLRALRLFDDWEGAQTPDVQVALLEKATELDPKFVLAHAALSRALLVAYGSDRDSERLVRAVKAAETAVALDAAEPDARLARAAALRATGRNAEAISDLLQLVAMNPRNDAALTELASAYSQAGNPGRQEANLRQALNVRPDFWSHWNALGVALLDIGGYREAREAFEKASLLAPAMLAPRQNLAILEIVEGNYAAAIERFQALPNPGSDASTQTNLGTAYFYTGRLEEAERAFRTAVRLEPKQPLYRRNLADVLLQLKRLEEARAEYLRAAALAEEQLAVNPSESLQLRHAFYLSRAGECTRAVAAANAVAARIELTANSAHSLAQTLAGCGQKREALGYLGRALELGYSAKRVRDQDEFAALRGDPEFDRLLAGAAQR